MKSPDGIFFEINLNLLPLPIYVSIGQEPQHLLDSLSGENEGVDCSELLEVLSNQDVSLAQTIHLNNGATIIYLYDMPKTLFDLCTVVHEATHASHFVLDRVGIPINLDNTEIQSYTISYITEQIFKQFHNSKLTLEPANNVVIEFVQTKKQNKTKEASSTKSPKKKPSKKNKTHQ